MKFYESNIRILIKWLGEIQQGLQKQDVSNKKEYITDIGKGINAMGSLQKESPSENIPSSNHYQINNKWIDVILDELFSFNNMGDEYICSVTESTLKTNGLKKLIDKELSTPVFFRGEHNFGWELISKIGRTHTIDWNEEDKHKVTKLELNLLREFQKKVKSDKQLKKKIFDNRKILEDNNAGWWSIMQHYDEVNGTRLIDITSSLYSALYFACANWDGSVDSSIDGKLYMFSSQPGRGETNNPDMWESKVYGCEDNIKTTVKTYFDIQGHTEIPRFRVSPEINNRVLSQDGYFIWQACFDKKFNHIAQRFPLRVHRDYKETIIKELATMGYTRKRILAQNRFNREQAYKW